MIVHRGGGASAMFDDDRDADAYVEWMRPQTSDVFTLEPCDHSIGEVEDMDETIEEAHTEAQEEADGLREDLETEREEHRALVARVNAALVIVDMDPTAVWPLRATIAAIKEALSGK